jgi:hypothetical protein
MTRRFFKFLTLAPLCAVSHGALGANFTLYDSLASFEAVIGGPAPSVQDFDAFPAGTDLNAFEFLPGVFATSNFSNLGVFGPDPNLFGFGGTVRNVGAATYIFDFTQDYAAVAFDVDGWNPASPGPAIANVQFSDGTSASFQIMQNGASEETPVFFGLSSANAFIRRIFWQEGPGIGGSGNEEVGFDNIRVSPTIVPLPPAFWLFGTSLIGMMLASRPRSA